MADARGDAERVARWAARAWRGHMLYDDLTQEARVAVWQAERTFDPDRGMSALSWARLAARRAVIDAARAWLGRGHRPAAVALDPAAGPPVVDVYPVEHPAPAPPADLTAAERVVWDRLARGFRGAQIARLHGVTESNVSHRVASIRRKYRAAERQLGSSAA